MNTIYCAALLTSYNILCYDVNVIDFCAFSHFGNMEYFPWGLTYPIAYAVQDCNKVIELLYL